jgi:hypothetical protein
VSFIRSVCNGRIIGCWLDERVLIVSANVGSLFTYVYWTDLEMLIETTVTSELILRHWYRISSVFQPVITSGYS